MVTILGIRHHGVGSARQLEKRLAELQPDCILVEGAPEIAEVFSYIGQEGLVPPVAVMIYEINQPRLYSFYPFTDFSPEWVAINYANRKKIPVSAIDLPAKLKLEERSNNEKEELLTENPLLVFAETTHHRFSYRKLDDSCRNLRSLSISCIYPNIFQQII